MYNCSLLKMRNIINRYGKLVPIEQNFDVPFEIKRIYYIYDVESDIIRGCHAHKRLNQVLICLKGNVKVKVKTPNEEAIYELFDPSVGLFIGNMVWREMYAFSEDAVLLALASEHYNEDDYIRNYDFYIEATKDRF